MDAKEIIISLVIIMVLGVVMISIVLPTTIDGIALSQYAGTVSNEVFAGTLLTPATLTKYVAEVISFEQGSTTSVANTTALLAANNSRLLQLSRPYTGANRTLTVYSAGSALDYVNVSLNGVVLGKLSSSPESWIGVGSTLVDGANTVKFTNYNGTTTNITNVSISYTSFADYTNYTVASGKITPLDTGTYRASYYYANTNTNNALNLLNAIPLLLAVMFMLVVIGAFKMAS